MLENYLNQEARAKIRNINHHQHPPFKGPPHEDFPITNTSPHYIRDPKVSSIFHQFNVISIVYNNRLEEFIPVI